MITSSLKIPDLEKILSQLSFGFGLLFQPGARDACHQAVLAAPDADAAELRNWLSENFAPPEFTGAVGRDYIARGWISYVLAEQAKKNGDVAAAWYHVSQARFHEGQMVAEFEAMQRIDRIRAAGRKGGQKTGAKRSPLMRECIHLLRTRQPVGGWTSHEHAFDSICAELLDFSARDGESLTRDTLAPKVMDWLAKRPDIQEAYRKESGQP